MGDDRAMTYEDGGKVVYRASALGACSRALVASRLGLTPLSTPEWLQEKFDQGNRGEDVVFSLMGIKPIDAQKELEVVINERVVVRGHIDGMINKGLGAEVKCLSAMSAKKFAMPNRWELFPYYAAQVSVYMYASGLLPWQMLIGEKDENGDVTRVQTYDVHEPPMKLDDIVRKVLAIEAQVEKSAVPEKCDAVMYPCPFYYLHEDDVETKEVKDEKFEGLLTAFSKVKRDIGEMEDVKKELSKEITAKFNAMGMKGGKIVAGGWTVTDVVQATRRSLDVGRLREKMGDELEGFYKLQAEVRYPLVKKAKQTKKEGGDGNGGEGNG